MQITDFFSAAAIAARYTEDPSNSVAYYGAGLFPVQKKMGLDLRWIRGHKGLPVSLMPSNFDAKSTLRSREGFKIAETEMPFFRESMLVKEKDEQDIMRVTSSNDPYAQEILSRIFDDTNTLVSGADVVPERMRMQLLAPTVDGSPKILIEANGVQYSYNYDKDGSYQANNYTAIAGATDKWDDHAQSDPLKDLEEAMDKVEDATGSRPSIALMSKATMKHLVQNEKIRAAILAQNTNANIFMTSALVSSLVSNLLGLTIVVYNKKYKDEEGKVHQFYPDGFVTLLPDGALGTTWYGTTPEERTLMGHPEADVRVVNTGVAIAVTVTSDPVNTKTTVSEIVLPSYERMDETYVLKVYDPS